jgi:glycosyltransferase involved in cell wall biosynthesis
MKVSIVIPAYNAANTISSCIEACYAQDYPGREVIVVDDGSTDDTEDIVRRHPVRYLRQDNAGPASARNRGWRAATGEVICFTDSDCVPAHDWVSKLVEEYTSKEIGGVGGTYDIVNDHSLLASCVHEEIVQRHLRMPRQVNYLGSFNVSYRRTVLEQIGGFYESYRMASGEDNELAYQVIKRGYRLIFTKDARVAHHHPEHLLRYLKQQFWHGYWRVKIYRRHPGMVRGDSYGGHLDFLQPPLALALLCMLPFSFWGFGATVLLALLLLYLALQLPMALAIVKRTGKMNYLSLAFITFLRGFARGTGMAWGIFRFFIIESILRRG